MISSIIATFIMCLISFSTPPELDDCLGVVHPNYDHYVFISQVLCDCPPGYATDYSCFLDERAAFLDALEQINGSYQDLVCVCLQRWNVDHNDAALLACMDNAVTTMKQSMQSAYVIFRFRCSSYCCIAQP